MVRDMEDVATCASVQVGRVPPKWVKLVPAGEFPSKDDEPYRLVDAEAVAAASNARRGDGAVVIDFEHQTEGGEIAPAAGWISEFVARDGAVWGRVKWTKRAKALLRALEYRYLSPVFLFDKVSRAVKVVLRAGLTNAPALDMPALAKAAKKANEKGDAMELADIAKALGLGEDASEQDVKDAIAKRDAGSGVAALKALGLGEDASEQDVKDAIAKRDAGSGVAALKALGLGEDASEQDVKDALAKLKAPNGAGDVVPKALFDAMAAREQARTDREAEESVDKAIKAGQLTPALRPWGIALAKNSPEAWAKFREDTPKNLLFTGAKAPTTNADGAPVGLAKKVAKSLGVTDAEYTASSTALAALREAS